MTEDQIKEAIDQCKIHCRILTETDYHSVSLRGVLYTLGYQSDQADEVITYCYNAGFNYCIDPMFKSKGVYPDFKEEHTPEFACYWGPDQLESRLACVR